MVCFPKSCLICFGDLHGSLGFCLCPFSCQNYNFFFFFSFCMLNATSVQFLNVPQLRKGKYPMPSPLILSVWKLIAIDKENWELPSFWVVFFFPLLKERAWLWLKKCCVVFQVLCCTHSYDSILTHALSAKGGFWMPIYLISFVGSLMRGK